ncbi:MAG: hypothetical protein J5766_03750 [Clostridia bacterium]|nr:hypothetical protein [Clostridia bacterium]
MKKVFAILFSIILLASVSVFGVSAETTEKEWSRLTGPAEFSITKDGVSLSATDGLTFYKYTRDKIDITDFSCTFTLEQDNWWDGHDGEHGYYYSIILTNKAAHSGSQGLFLLLFPTSGHSMRIEGQILNTGFLLSPSYVELDVDTMGPITMHGKVVNGNSYEISFDNCKDTYKFAIPENYQFHKDLDGQGYFGFGANVSGDDENIKMTVSKVNGIETVGTQEAEEKTDTSKETTAAPDNQGTTANATGSVNTTGQSGTTIDSGTTSTMFTILIVTVAALFLIVVVGFVIIAIFIYKKTK